MIIISQSRARLRNHCKQAHYFKFVENLRPRKVKRPFQFGRLIHSLIEADANGDEWSDALDAFENANAKLLAIHAEEYGNLVQDTRFIATDYFEYWADDPLVFVRRKKRAAEHVMELELEDGIVFKGILDGVVSAKGGRWIIDHKSYGSRMPNDDERWRSLQGAAYIRVLQELGWFGKINGMLWNYIKSKLPAPPKLTKTGALSRAKDAYTLPSVAVDFAEREGFELDEEYMERCYEYRSTVFSRVYAPVQRTVVDAQFNNLVETARDIADHPNRKEKNIGRHCGWCDYESICRAELQGSDVDFIKERAYVVEKDSDRYDLPDDNSD